MLCCFFKEKTMGSIVEAVIGCKHEGRIIVSAAPDENTNGIWLYFEDGSVEVKSPSSVQLIIQENRIKSEY